MQIMEERARGSRAKAKKGGKSQEKGGKGDSRTCWILRQSRAHCSVVENNRNLYAIEEEEHEIHEEALHNDEELQERRLLDLGEHEQWQEVISRRGKPLMPHYRAWEATQTRARRKHRGENMS